jgi:multimeric flavodoxin WrbA
MNILILNGSPKGENSNTFKLTQAFIDGITMAQSVLKHRFRYGRIFPKVK